MTAFVSIASKPRSKRTAKGLILTGADGKHARHDGRHDEYETEHTRRPALDAGTVIAESFDGDLVFDAWGGYDPFGDTRSNRLGSNVWTSESSGFVCSIPERRKVQKPKKPAPVKVVAPVGPELPTHDEAGRPIVYKTDDAWSYRLWR